MRSLTAKGPFDSLRFYEEHTFYPKTFFYFDVDVDVDGGLFLSLNLLIII